MPLYPTFPDSIEEVDVIIAGGGTAGCVVASRLVDAYPHLSVLVVEGGPNNDLPSITYPVLFLANIQPGSDTAIFYKGNKASELAGREVIVQSGGVLGGGSSVNMLTYSRAQRSDLDSWHSPGWSAEEIIPYMKKAETYHGPGKNNTHGFEGPVHISDGRFQSVRVTEDFIKAAGMLGYPEVDDLFDLETINGVQRNLRYTTLDGKRQDSATCYVHPKLQDGNHPNLHVVINTQVVRVLIENKKAAGVEIRPRQATNNSTATEQPTRHVTARKLVILSCGALGTPSVLERSGVGSPEVLKRAGVPLIADVLGVGQGYQDHQLLLYPYRSSLNPEETMDAMAAGRISPGEMIKNNDPKLGWNCQDVVARIRPNDEEAATLGPELDEAWNRNYKPFPDRPLGHMALVSTYAEDQKLVPVGQYFSMSTFITYPESRGHVHITGPGISDPLDFNPGFLSDSNQVDIKQHVWMYKKQREIVRRMSTYRGEVAIGHPPFPASSAAVCTGVTQAQTDVAQDIVYTPEDDVVIEQWLREKVETTWHSLGTCKMAPLGDLGVVDPRLGVHTVKGLKIADLSIVPVNVAANTHNMALVIGEKAADLFIEDLSLSEN